MSSVEGASASGNVDLTGKTEPGSQDLGKDEFLELLVTQLKHQDPLDPMDDKEFIAQTAQFSALEQMQNLNNTMSSFVESQSRKQELTYASSFIDKQVEIVQTVEGEDGEKEELAPITGKVEKVIISQDRASQIVVDGKEYSIEDVQKVLSEGSAGEETA
ncbi:flagellar hook assembly protein FlgD [Natroniella acetigena]|uniref:flagellar hook assembly protein FlgD n=1 Tax=Natroniella acetigena TaxID=52004 RepID=UPI00200B4AE7|nr:flagellar hook assembly protein FlgD [Natroniella acetigena]MCK8826311.1 flagellar hook assembly protein FlgD [Natroniella acetigena]